MGFRIKARPTKPTRQTTNRTEDITNYSTVGQLYYYFKSRGIDPELVYIETEYGYGSNCNRVKVEWQELESNESLKKRIDDYKEKLKEYNKWKKEHKAEIAQYYKDQEDKKKKEIEAKKRKLRKELKKLEQENSDA